MQSIRLANIKPINDNDNILYYQFKFNKFNEYIPNHTNLNNTSRIKVSIIMDKYMGIRKYGKIPWYNELSRTNTNITTNNLQLSLIKYFNNEINNCKKILSIPVLFTKETYIAYSSYINSINKLICPKNYEKMTDTFCIQDETYLLDEILNDDNFNSDKMTIDIVKINKNYSCNQLISDKLLLKLEKMNNVCTYEDNNIIVIKYF